MQLSEFSAMMERVAPRELAMDFDNVGLLVGTRKKEIQKVLIALDATPDVVQEAHAGGFDLILTHHPLLLKPQNAVLPDAVETAVAFSLIQKGIALFAAHTNLDAAQGGVNDVLANKLGLADIEPLLPDGLGRIGNLTKGVTLKQFALLVERELDTTAMVAGDGAMQVKRVAVIGGSGGSEIQAAHAEGADVLVTGEAKHHEALYARQLGCSIIAAGHFETENVVCKALIECLQSMDSRIEYKLAQSSRPCLVRAERL